jgi:CBS domain-containing protein
MARVADILADKGNQIHTIGEHASVHDAVALMNQQKIGALVVVDDTERVAGIFTERDVLRRVVGSIRNPADTRVGEVMSGDVVCATAQMPLEDVRALLMQRRIRHLPIVDDAGKLQGLISIGDVNAHFANDHQVQLEYLKEYIHGRV